MTRVLVSALYRRASASLLCSPGLSSALEAALPAAQALPRSSSTSGALLSRARAAPFALVPVRQGWFFSSQGGGQQQPGGRREEPPSHNQQAGEKVSAHVSFFVKEEAPEFPGDAEGVEGAGGPDDGWSEAKASGSEAVVRGALRTRGRVAP